MEVDNAEGLLMDDTSKGVPHNFNWRLSKSRVIAGDLRHHSDFG